MKIKTSELTGPALDWAVARALGKRPSLFIFAKTGKLVDEHNYSTNWSQGGPIIEREHIDIRNTFTEGGYRTAESIDAAHASINLPNGATVFNPVKAFWEYGPTPLIAAMRCYVASKLGEEVEIPDELIGE